MYQIYSAWRDRWEYADLKVNRHIIYHSTVTFTSMNDYIQDEALVLYNNGLPVDVVIVDSVAKNNMTVTVIARNPVNDFLTMNVQSAKAIPYNGVDDTNSNMPNCRLAVDGLYQSCSRYRSPAHGYWADIDFIMNQINSIPQSQQIQQWGSLPYGAGGVQTSSLLTLKPNELWVTMNPTHKGSDIFNQLIQRGWFLDIKSISFAPSPVTNNAGSPSTENVPWIEWQFSQIPFFDQTTVANPNILGQWIAPEDKPNAGVYAYQQNRIVVTLGTSYTGGISSVVYSDGRGGADYNYGVTTIASANPFQDASLYASGNSRQASTSIQVDESLITVPSKLTETVMTDGDLISVPDMGGGSDLLGGVPTYQTALSDYLAPRLMTPQPATMFFTDDVTDDYVGTYIIFNNTTYLITEQYDNLLASSNISERIMN